MTFKRTDKQIALEIKAVQLKIEIYNLYLK